ncbi:MAG TPA: helix-turn-helix domain-containing protein [Acidimicrobiales bacterium]|nr:helix-turn-helix domain-containing protein [Acidimicrobiales bacterium]
MQVVLDAEAVAADDRAVDAALRCIARWGLVKTTVDDVAREAGVARATLYRLFPGGRDALLGAVVAREVDRVTSLLAAAAAGATTLEDALVACAVAASMAAREHAALQFLLAHEPESVLPHLAFQGLDDLLARAAEAAGPLLAPWLGDPEDRARGAEWLARVVLSYTLAPSPDVDPADPVSARAFIRAFILPGLPRSIV